MPTRPARPRPRAGRTARRGVVGVVVVAVVLIAGAALAFTVRGSVARDSAATPSPVADARAGVAQGDESASIEVPQLVGMPVDEAKVLLASAGLVLKVKAEGKPLGEGELQRVDEQQPSYGALVAQGACVVVSARPAARSNREGAKGAPRHVVCIDPGHQSSADISPEPVGPKAMKTKAKISAGVTGVKTGLAEYEIALQISMNLKRQLEARGVTVVVTRSTNDVNLSNAERAKIANKAKADVFVRVHGGGSPDADEAGVALLYPASNRWTKPIASRSHRAAAAIHRSLIASTGAPDRGRRAIAGQAGFNWSQVPAVLVECGYQSNAVEDRLLASPHYQDRVAQGIADGIMAYLQAEEAR